METYKDNQNVSEVLKSLNNMKLAFDELPVKENKVSMSAEGFNKIKSEVTALRKKIVDTP